MKLVHEYSQSDQRFDAEPTGVCQALSARWIVSRALWDSKRDGIWKEGRWMGSHKDMEPHVWRTYRATRAARTAVAREEADQMEQVKASFNREKQALIRRQQHRGMGRVDFDDAKLMVSHVPPGYSAADLDDRLSQVYIPTLPRMLEALKNDISEHGGLDGAVHTQRGVKASAAGSFVCSLGEGYSVIDIRDRNLSNRGGAHAIAAELRSTESRLFDPNYGEWESEPRDNPRSSVGVLLHYLLSKEYSLEEVDYLSVIHFPLKRDQT